MRSRIALHDPILVLWQGASSVTAQGTAATSDATATGGKASSSSDAIVVRAILVGERIDTHRMKAGEILNNAPLTLRLDAGRIAVVFRYGVVVLFDADDAAERAFLARIAPFVISPFQSCESDLVRLQIGQDLNEGEISPGGIQLRQASLERFQLVGDVLAKSLILAHYETRFTEFFDRVEPVAAKLREKGQAGVSGRWLLRHIGIILSIQHRMVGRVETGEKPDLLWDHPELERVHSRLAEEYELRDRSRILERKLDVISRTIETLLGLVQNRSALRVEWYVVVLIVAELAFAVFQFLLHR